VPTDDDARLAAELVTQAAALAARMRAGDALTVSRKTSVSDVVTDADRAAEQLVLDTLRRERPDDGVLGEEGAAVASRSGRRWVVDPVDGTYNFASGSDYWCSAVALVDGEELLLGAVAHHATGSVVVGGPQRPTTRDGEPVPPVHDDPLELVSAGTYLHPGFFGEPSVHDPWTRAVSRPATIRMLGSGSMDLVGVATGRLGCWFQHSTPSWDWLPGAAIVAGAGGTTLRVDVGGRTWSVAGGARSVAEVVAALEG
jgi:fructose-1,6-bisphosphatase/inositol monophosphatase family enzyme